MVAWARDEILRLLHPFMPFITEELWRVTAADAQAAANTGAGQAPAGREALLVLSAWPDLRSFENDAAEAEIGWLIDLVTAIRSVRAEMNVPPATLLPLVLVGTSGDTQARASRWIDVIKRLARLSSIDFADKAPESAVQLIVRGEIAALPLAGVIDLAAERTRLEKEMGKVAADIARIDAKLGNADFIRRAPEDVVEGEREKREEAEARGAKITEALTRLKGAA
jgi:valyl-tRNA synthetase